MKALLQTLIPSRMKTVSKTAAVILFGIHGLASAQDRQVFFDVEDPGEDKSVELWGLDTAWLWDQNVIRGVEFMGIDRVDVVRFSFTGDKPLVNGDLEASRQAEFDERMRIVDTYTGPDTALYFNNDSEGIDPYFRDTTTKVRADRWAQLINLTRQKCEDAGRTVISVAPFNEPDLTSNNLGDPARLADICNLLRNDPAYSAAFANIRLSGGNTLNNDQAVAWYSPYKGILDEGATHQLAGIFDTYAQFMQYVTDQGDWATNDELHNVMECMVGAEYGMKTGIWWGTAEFARGEFVKASDGDRLGYAEHRTNWTAASVYRAPSGKVQAFVGESERQARPTSYQFISKGRDVFFDGQGPQRTFTVRTTGGAGYQTEAHKNAERVVRITWGEDVAYSPIGRFTIVNRQTGMVMEVAGPEIGDNIQQGSPSGSTYQQWDVTHVDNQVGGDWSYYNIKSVPSGRTPDVWNWDLSAGADVRQYDFAGGTNQQWVIEYVEDGFFHIRSRHSGKYLEVAGGSSNAGANIQMGNLVEGTGGYFQQWRFIPITATVEFLPPMTPTGLTATPKAVSVTLNWNANAESDLAGYNVYRSATGVDGSYELIARGVTETSYADKTASASHPNYYRVKAVDQSRNRSTYSNRVMAMATGGNTLVMRLDWEGSYADSSGNGNDAQVTNWLGWGTGKVGLYALGFGGSGTYAAVPVSVADYDSMTIATWVYWNGFTDNQRIFDFGNGTEEGMYLTPKATGAGLRFGIKQGDYEATLDSTALTNGKWVHLAVTIGDGVAELFVDGALADSKEVALSPSDIGPVLNYIGKSQSSSDPWYAGMIDDFRVYNYPLYDWEIASLAGTTAPGSLEPGVWQETAIGYVYGFDQDWGYSSTMGFVYLKFPWIYQVNYGWSCLGNYESSPQYGVSNYQYNYADGWIFTKPSYGTRFWEVGTSGPAIFKDFLNP